LEISVMSKRKLDNLSLAAEPLDEDEQPTGASTTEGSSTKASRLRWSAKKIIYVLYIGKSCHFDFKLLRHMS
jgi:hypothetical protein